jgi:hypothetical protein
MKRKNDFILQNVGGENLLVPLGQQVVDLNGLIILNVTGRFLWELLADDHSVHDLAMLLAERFNVDSMHALPDVQTFMDDIEVLGLLEA